MHKWSNIQTTNITEHRDRNLFFKNVPMKPWQRSLWVAIESIGYGVVMWFVVIGTIDGRAEEIAHGSWLVVGFLAALYAGVLLSGFFGKRNLISFDNLLLLCAAATIGVHLTVFLPTGYYPASSLYPIYYITVIIFAATGNPRYWLGALGLCFGAEIASLIVVAPETASSNPAFRMMGACVKVVPQIGMAGLMSLCALLVSGNHVRILRRKTASSDFPTQTISGHNQAKTVIAGSATKQHYLKSEKIGDRQKTKTIVLPPATQHLYLRADTTMTDTGERPVDQRHTPDSVLSSVVYFMGRNFKAYSALGFVYQPDKNAFVLNAFNSRSVSIAATAEIPLDQGHIGAIGISKQSFVSGDCALYNVDMPYYASNEMINSIMGFPIVSEGKELLGALIVDSKDKNAFSEQHKEILGRFSSLAAALIINVRMRIFQEQTTRQFQILYESSQKFTNAHKTIEVIDVLFQMVGEITQASRCVAVTFDERQNTAVITRHRRTPGRNLVFGQRRHLLHGLPHQTADRRRRFPAGSTADVPLRRQRTPQPSNPFPYRYPAC
jgi:putative methionine-R-sulfoxide reductase with GAF domain